MAFCWSTRDADAFFELRAHTEASVVLLSSDDFGLVAKTCYARGGPFDLGSWGVASSLVTSSH